MKSGMNLNLVSDVNLQYHQENQHERTSLETSVPQLIGLISTKLCDGLPVVSEESKVKYVKQLKSTAYQVLLNNLNKAKDNEFMDRDVLIGMLVEKMASFDLWNKENNEELHNLIDKVSDTLTNDPSLGSVLQFLLCMAGTSSSSLSTSKSQPSSIDGIINKSRHLLQKRLSSYSNINKSRSFNLVPSVFDSKIITDGLTHAGLLKVPNINEFPFDSAPGSKLSLFEKFNSVWSHKNFSDINDLSSNHKIKSFSIPELNSDVPRSLTIPSIRSSHMVDEGYATPDKDTLYERDSSCIGNTSSQDIWRNFTVQNLQKVQRYTWESLGKAETKVEPPFLMESDVDTVEYWKRYMKITQMSSSPSSLQNSVASIASSTSRDDRSNCLSLGTMPLKDFFRDVKYLLIAINSNTFYYDEIANSFVIRSDVSIPGITPEGLESYSKDFISCGNSFRLLTLLISKRKFVVANKSTENSTTVSSTISDLFIPRGLNAVTSSDSCNINDGATAVGSEGLVFEAMCSSISTFLQLYRGILIKMLKLESNTLLDVKSWLHPLQQQLQFLVQLCRPSPSSHVLPVGGALLSHIYNAVQVTVSLPFSYILYYILENCSKVYFRFLEKWLFEGICDDPYGEFFIEMRSSYETCLDRSYWRKTFVLKEEKVPVFLSTIANDIYVCGKTLNLVKFCNQNDQFCQKLETLSPRMRPCLDERSLKQLTEDYQNFVELCSEESKMPLLSPKQETAEEKEVWYENVAAQRAVSILRIKEARLDKQRKDEENKRQLFLKAKENMEDAKKRKKDDRINEIKEEQKILKKLAEDSLIYATRKEEEKRRITQFYKSLSDAAELRRTKTEWKLKRMRLHNQRVDFLMKEKRCLNEEILRYKSNELLSTYNKVNKQFSDTTVRERDGVEASRSSVGSWLTCQSKDSSLALYSANGSDIKNNSFDGNVFKNLSNIKNQESSGNRLRRNSFTDLMSSSHELPVNRKKSSSDTDIYSSSTSGFSSRNTFMNLRGLVPCSTTNIIAAQADNILFNNNSNVSVTNNKNDNITSKVVDSSNTFKNILNLNDSEDINKYIDDNSNGNVDKSVDPSERNKVFHDSRKQAKLNKLKVYEDEFDIQTSPRHKDLESETSTDLTNCKDRVIKKKLKSVENAIKERTQELELAFKEVVESRKQAARNKAKAMNDYHFLDVCETNKIDNIVTDMKPENNTGFMTPSNILPDELEDKVPVIKRDVITDIKDDNDELNVVESLHNIMDSEYVNSDGHFILHQKPLIVDIADKFLTTKPTPENLDVADITTIHYCLFKSVLTATEVQKSFMTAAVLKLFVVDEKLKDHLKCIRKHFFLLDGEYGRTLTRDLFSDLETVEHPSGLLTHLRLNAILRSAIRSNNNESSLIDRLSFGVKETPLAFLLTDPDVLTCLSMRYVTHWPLNIILTDEAIFNYDKVFAFQIKLQRIAWVLEQDIQLLKMPNMTRSRHHRQLQIFRHTMTQFVRALNHYVTRIALEDSWLEFKNALKKVNSLDSLYAAHVEYVKMTLFRCLLNKRSEPIQKTLIELMRTILTFHELLRSGEWVYDNETGNHTHSAFARLLHQYSSFGRIAKHFVKYLHHLVVRGYQPHLDLLITFLSGNNFYIG